MDRYLNKNGVVRFWNKIKELLGTKVDKKDIEPVIIDDISFFELLIYSEDSENYDTSVFTEVTPELISILYDKAKEASDDNRPLMISYSPLEKDVEPIWFELDKVVVDDEASLSTIINNFVYTVYINNTDDTIAIKKLNNTSINISDIKNQLNDKASKEELQAEVDNLNDSKVDKVEGKQLSTEDFTTLLKNKLDSLENYDDSNIQTKLEELKTNLDTILNSEDATTVIDTFQEIEDFLQGITNTETLTGLLQDLKSDIVALIPTDYVKKEHLSDGTDVNTVIDAGIYRLENNVINVPNDYYNYGQLIVIRGGGDTIAQIIFPYSRITFPIIRWGCPYDVGGGEGWSDWKELLTSKGTSSQFLKADGSVDGTAYLPTTGGTISNTEYGTFEIKREVNVKAGCAIKYSTNNGVLGYIGIGGTNSEDSYPYFSRGLTGTVKLWHEDNDGAGSGLDADLLDGKQPADLNVGSADKLTTKQLTNEDLNDIKSNGSYIVYRGNEGNTCANKPKGVLSFGLQCIYIGDGKYKHIITDTYSGITYERYLKSSGWSPWKKMLTEDDITSLESRISALENK